MSIKPYIVLAGAIYYPDRWDDFAGNAETLEEARAIATKAVTEQYRGWWQIIDLRTMKVVEEGYGGSADGATPSATGANRE